MLVLFFQELFEFLILRIERDHLPDVLIYQVSLVELRRYAEDPRTIFRTPQLIVTEERREFRLSVFSAHYEEDLSKLSPPLSVHDPIY